MANGTRAQLIAALHPDWSPDQIQQAIAAEVASGAIVLNSDGTWSVPGQPADATRFQTDVVGDPFAMLNGIDPLWIAVGGIAILYWLWRK